MIDCPFHKQEFTDLNCKNRRLIALETKNIPGSGKKFPECLECRLFKEDKKIVKIENAESINTFLSPEADQVNQKSAPQANPDKRVKICLECKEEKKHFGRGLCSSCYGKLKKEGSLGKYPPLQNPNNRGEPFKHKASDSNPVAFPKSESPREERIPLVIIKPGKNWVEPEKAIESTDNTGFVRFLGTFPEIMKFVTDRASRDLRQVDMQIVWFLRDAMEKEK